MTIPIGRVNWDRLDVIRFEGLIWGRNLMKIPITIVITAITPQVSTFFNPLRPSRSRRVMMSQKVAAKKIGLMFPGNSLERLSPSPMR